MEATYTKHKKLAQQFMRYFLVAGLGYIVDFSILYILHEFAHLHYLTSAAVSFLCGLIVVYVMSSIFVFSNSKLKSKSLEFGAFTLIGIVGLGILSISMWTLTGLLGINYLIAKVAATVGVYIWNFFARRALYHN